jgi:hypothetical protein
MLRLSPTAILFSVMLIFGGLVVVRSLAARRPTAARRQGDEAGMAQMDFAQHLFRAVEEGSLLDSRAVPEQSMRDIAARKSWNQPSETASSVSVPDGSRTTGTT